MLHSKVRYYHQYPLNYKDKARPRYHNLLGALHLVAKALEIWSIMVASRLVCLITMFLTGRKSGLPIPYITRPNEVSELSGFIDPLLVRTLPKPFRRNGTKRRGSESGYLLALLLLLAVSAT